jgi:hypothetical protein
MSAARLTSLERAVLLTVVYGDLFDHPLSLDELHRYLVLERASPEQVASAARGLVGTRLWECDGCFGLLGREAVREVRVRRRAASAPRWEAAQRFARWLARVPFLELVAVCGSQAVENAEQSGDVDLFLIAREGRLWIAQVAVMLLRRLAERRLGHMCPNHLLTTAALDAGSRDLYTAREVVQAVPLWGEAAYDRFLEANVWVRELLPQTPPGGRRERLGSAPAAPRARALERLLGGRPGDVLDRVLHRLLLLYYPLRLGGRGLRAPDFRAAYRRDRQTVVAGGYAGPVAAAFRERARARLGDEVPEALLERLFPQPPVEAPPHRVYDALFRERYGSGVV